MIRNAWYAAGFSPDFARGCLHTPVVAGVPLVLWRTGGREVVAYEGHERGRALADALAHPVAEKDGLVWVWAGAPERAERVAVPGTPEILGWQTVRSEPAEVPASSRLLVENLLDIRRSYPLHVRSLAGTTRIAMRVERRTIGGVETVRTLRRGHDQRLPPVMRGWFGYDVVDREHTHHVLGPGVTRIQVRVAPGGLGGEREKGYVVHHLHTPVAPGKLRWWWTVSCQDRTLADLIAPDIATMAAGYRFALEAQESMLTHPEQELEDVPVKTDGAVVLLRRILEDLERREDSPDHTELARLRTGTSRTDAGGR